MSSANQRPGDNMADGKLGVVIFAAAYFLILGVLLPVIDAGNQYHTGTATAPSAPTAPTNILDYVFGFFGYTWTVINLMWGISISIPMVGIFNVVMGIAGAWCAVEIVRGV